MSSSSNQTSSGSDDGDDFPVAAIVCLAVGAYVLLIIIIIIIKHKLSSRGSCTSDCCQPVEEGKRPCCCTLCARCGDSCMCCGNCSVNGCLTKLCGQPKRTNCVDILLCNCGGCTENCCNSCKCCSCGCSCDCLQKIQCCRGCSCSAPSCSCPKCCGGCFGDTSAGACGCFCLEVKLRSPRTGGLQRSHSAPPGKVDSIEKQFSTHFPPMKDGGSREGHAVFIMANAHRDVLRSRPSSGRSNASVNSTPMPPHSLPTENKGNLAPTLNRGHSSNNHQKDAINSIRTAKTEEEGRRQLPQGSRHSSRRSLRVGRQSQRFPQHVLVSSESCQADSPHLVPSPTSDAVVTSRSLPPPRTLSTRRLPPLKNGPQGVEKLSKTH